MQRNTRTKRETIAMAAAAHKDDTRSVVINMRAPLVVRKLIDRAASVLGKTRSEFMLDSARRTAEDVLLDQKLFVLDEERYAAFLNLLDEPPKPVEELKRLLSTKAPWER